MTFLILNLISLIKKKIRLFFDISKVQTEQKWA